MKQLIAKDWVSLYKYDTTSWDIAEGQWFSTGTTVYNLKKPVENGVNHHNIEINLIFIHNKHQPSSQCFNTDMIEYCSSDIY